MAPLGYASNSSAGGYSSLVIDGLKVKGKKKTPTTASEMLAFTVIGQEDVMVEGGKIHAWKAEEHRLEDRKWLATYWLIDKSPSMVYGESPLPDGKMQKFTEVEITSGG
jgi:hypothetical protein